MIALDQARRLLDAPPPDPVPGQTALDLPAEPHPGPECEHGNPRCRTAPARFYPCGWKCDAHQPSKTHRRR
ncbi:aromatic ring-opening dioxygenase LigA [Streptomyces fradiae]|uniref:aromatic ring-opening dioxygenase LigA n=1 Tax=Streptomyces fradiae TaxID=1906 RepID=UPI0033D33A63